MNETAISGNERRAAEAVHAACIREVVQAYEEACISGLCGEGAFEAAIGRLRTLDLDTVLARVK